MSIQINSGTTAVNWESLLAEIGTVEKTTGTDGKELFTVTMRVDGEDKTYTFGIPDDLDLPETVDQYAINTLCDKLLEMKDTFKLSNEDVATLRDNLSSALAAVNKSGAVNMSSTTVMFDIYKLMALLVEVAQKQRDASREQRLAENVQIQVSILQQAEAQRTAALTSLLASVACCILQVGASIGMMVKQNAAFKQQMGTLKTTGVTDAKIQLAEAKASLNKAEIAAKANDIVKPDEAKPAVKPDANAGAEKLEPVAKQDGVEPKLAEKPADAAKPNEAEPAAKPDANAKAEEPEPVAKQDGAEPKLAEKPADAAKPNEAEPAAKPDAKAKAEEPEPAVKQDGVEPKPAEKPADAAKPDEAKPAEKPLSVADAKKAVLEAKIKLDAARAARMDDETYVSSTRTVARYDAMMNIVASVGQVAQSLIQNSNAYMQAGITEKGAEQQKAQEELDQTKDLFSQAQELVNQIIKLMQAVIAAESQSMRDSIQV